MDLAFLARLPQNPCFDSFIFRIEIYSWDFESYINPEKKKPLLMGYNRKFDLWAERFTLEEEKEVVVVVVVVLTFEAGKEEAEEEER